MYTNTCICMLYQYKFTHENRTPHSSGQLVMPHGCLEEMYSQATLACLLLYINFVGGNHTYIFLVESHTFDLDQERYLLFVTALLALPMLLVVQLTAQRH